VTALDIATLAPLDVAPRLERLRALLASESLDALLVSRLANIRYLTGFTGSAALLLVRPDAALFVTDGRYRTQAAEQLGAAGVDARIEIGTTSEEQRDALAAFAPGVGGRLGLEDHAVTWAQQRAYAERFAAELVPAGTLVEQLRRVKDPGEIDRIRAACAIGDEVFALLAPALREGPTEREFALALEVEMRRRGASGVSFDPIVASGPNAAKPHARPSDRPVARGELAVIDFGCVVDGYCSDMTRTVSVGDPGRAAAELWELVRDAQRAGCERVAAGVDASAVDAACRDVIASAGYGDHFTHSTGHGVGIEIHEDPRVSAASTATLQDRDIVTVEPGVYLPGVGGVRLEDTVVVTGGGAEPLTLSPKELVL
jgi:Xaa-Pro aminopeptidase